MATVLSTQAATTFPVYKPLAAGAVSFAYGVYTIASALSKDDIVGFFYLGPCKVVDGFFRADDIDTGTETFELDIGTSSDSDLLLDSGVQSGDPVTELKPNYAGAAKIHVAFNGLHSGPVSITTETRIQGLVVAAANAGGTGDLYCGAYIVE